MSIAHEAHLRRLHAAHETSRDVLGYPVKSFLASTGRSDGGRDCRKLQMTQDPRDYRLVGDGGNDPERATSAKRKVARLARL